MHINFAVFQLISAPNKPLRLVDKKLTPKYDIKVGKSVILWEYRLIDLLNT
jgi:hypothetical protein